MDQKILLSQDVIDKVRKYKTKLVESGLPVEKMIVFGSQARGQAKPWSDIDVCVVSSAFSDTFDDRLLLVHRITPDLIDIEPHPFTPEGLIDRWDPLASEITKYGITV